ncbi:short chain dehydrogenase reductase [Favolaschia claudopus]|uniref:Short chain dehydrogenase reductase n=1 Tax=Favolaschia claudopus TaxID=2862362 RepID=A0AAW0CHU2_9AGAR
MASQKTVLITGCSAGGIGFALATEFHVQGCRVFATARRLESMEALAALGIETLALDVTDIDAIKATKKEISSRTGGKLDILVNNAGQTISGAASDLEMSEVRGQFELNVVAPMCMVQEFLPLLISSGKACIANVGSVAAVIPTPFLSSYNASKAALRAYGNTLRLEVAPFNIRVVDLMTGTIESNVMKPYSIPEGSLYKSLEPQYHAALQVRDRAIPAEVYAQTVVAELLKPKPRYTLWAGAAASATWFMSNYMPSWLMDMALINLFGLSKFAEEVRKARASTQ